MLPSICPFCEGSVQLPLLNSGDSGAFVSVCVRASSCALCRFSKRPMCHQLSPPPFSSQGRLVFIADRRALFFIFRFRNKTLCYESSLPDSPALFLSSIFPVFCCWWTDFIVLEFWQMIFLRTRMDSLLHCEEEKHNKESFNLLWCQHSVRSGAGGATS